MATSARRPSDYRVNGGCDVALENVHGRSACCWCERYRAVLIAQKISIANPFGEPVGSSQEPFRHEAERIGPLITQSEATNTVNLFSRVDQDWGQLQAAAILRRIGSRPANPNVLSYGGDFPAYTLTRIWPPSGIERRNRTTSP